MNQFDIYVNKTVPLKFKGADMSFDLSHALFSSFDVDQGSRLLLKAVAKNVDAAAVGSIVDIGSGVGVLGIACARGYPGATLRMRDRDALACAFSERNARRNRVAPVSVDRALFLEGIEAERFDLVLCNVPAKAGPPVLDRFLRDLPGVVSDRGYGAVVVVAPIADAALASVKASGAEIVFSERGPGHTAIVFKRGAAAPAEPGSLWPTLERSEQAVKAGRAGYRVKGYWGLPEFDTPSFASELAMDMCENASAGLMVRRVAFVNPGVGRVACHVLARAKGATIDLCGRDALSTAASARNLALCPSGTAGSSPAGTSPAGSSPAATSYAFASELPDASYDLMVDMPDIVPRVDVTEESWAHAARALKRGGSFVAAMPSTAMDRFEHRRPKGWVRIAERKKKGFACAAWRLEG